MVYPLSSGRSLVLNEDGTKKLIASSPPEGAPEPAYDVSVTEADLRLAREMLSVKGGLLGENCPLSLAIRRVSQRGDVFVASVSSIAIDSESYGVTEGWGEAAIFVDWFNRNSRSCYPPTTTLPLRFRIERR